MEQAVQSGMAFSGGTYAGGLSSDTAMAGLAAVRQLEEHASQTPHVSRLAQLWQRRHKVNQAEMLELYQLVQAALAHYSPVELQALGETKEELVAQFIFTKVLMLERDPASVAEPAAHSAPSNSYAICAYFRRYLIDCLRSAGHQRCVSLEISGVAQEMEESHNAPVDDPIRLALVEFGLSEAIVTHRARRFIASLDDIDRLLLEGTLGSMAGHKGGLSRVAATHKIASYHYRAGKLGVTLRKDAVPADFEVTRIGRWVRTDLGIEIGEENQTAILIVFGILARESEALRLRAERQARREAVCAQINDSEATTEDSVESNEFCGEAETAPLCE